jgi:hypothetical protein
VGYNGRKRKPSAHQRQMTFFTVLFAALLIACVIAMLWFLNRTNP